MAEVDLGPFEQAVLLVVLRERSEAFALPLRRRLEEETGRPVSRGAFYATVERLARKGLLGWTLVRPPDGGRATKQRLFAITPEGVRALQEARDSLEFRWNRIAEALSDL